MGILRADRITGLGGANAITGSVRFHGNQDDLQLHPSSDFNFGTGDYTIEAWVYPVEFGRSQMIFAVHNADSTAAAGKFYFRSTNKFTYWSENAARIVSSTTYTESKWYHVALVNNSGTQTIYVDGTSQGTSTYGNGFGSDTFVVHIGRNAANNNQSMNGYISNIRVTKGTALYTSTFTPPTTRLIRRSDTVLLACNSASNVLNEETGKVIQSVRADINNSGPKASKFTPNSPVGFSTTTDVGSQYGSTFDGFGNFSTSTYMVPPGGNTRERNRGRGVIRGGMTPNSSALTKTAQYIEISSGGNTIDFGDGLDESYGGAGLASATRGVYNLGATTNTSPNSLVNTLEFITIANTANALDFGDLYFAIQHKAPMSNQTRGIFAAGLSPQSRVMMSFITIATLGDSQDFGDSIGGSYGLNQGGQAGSPTRGLIAGGSSASAPTEVEKIQFVTFASLGDAQDFGDLVDQNGYFNAGASSGTRALFAGGGNVGSPFTTVNTIQFVTIATTGNAIDFGDLTSTRYNGGGLSNSTRGCFAGGATYPGATRQNIIDFVTIATTGNASDFGDIAVNVNSVGTMSDSHGGL